jgi:hypothetical protein
MFNRNSLCNYFRVDSAQVSRLSTSTYVYWFEPLFEDLKYSYVYHLHILCTNFDHFEIHYSIQISTLKSTSGFVTHEVGALQVF